MVTETDLIEAASELLAEAAQAWSSYATAKTLFAFQAPNSPVSAPQFEELRVRLAACYGNAVSAFGASDHALRAELANKGDKPEPATAETLTLIREAAQGLQLEDAALAMLSKHIAGTGNLKAVDNHGAEWLLRFLSFFHDQAGLTPAEPMTAH